MKIQRMFGLGLVSLMSAAALAQPAVFTDLGTLSLGTTTVTNDSHVSGDIKWYRFVIGTDVLASNTNYLDIDTEGTTAFLTGNDTEIGLYRNDGTLVASDDDDGTSLLSQLSFGSGAGNRGTQGFTGASYNGRDGALVAGTYWLAVSGFNATFATTAWGVTTSSTRAGVVRASIRYNDPVPPPPPPSAIDLGTLALTSTTTQTDSHTAGQVRWYKFVVGNSYLNTNLNFLDIHTEGSNLFFDNDTEIAVYRNDGTVLASDNDDASGLLSQLSFGSGAQSRDRGFGGNLFNGGDGNVTPGTYYLAVSGFDATFGNAFTVTSTSTQTGDVSITLISGVGTAPPPPSSFIDLGTLNNPSTTVRTETHNAGDVVWYKFVLPSAVSGADWLDIDTEGTTDFLVGNDTEVGIYNSIGGLVASDDDDGSDLLTQLSFGSTAGDRGTQGFTGLAYNGRDGDLPAGTYYMAVSGFNTTFGPQFTVTTDSVRTGPVVLNLRYNRLVTVGVPVSGTITFLNTDGDSTNEKLNIIVWDSVNGVEVDSASNVIPDASGNFSVDLEVPDGTYDVYVKGNRHLQRLVASQTFTGGLSGLTASLIAGDIDNNNEVGPSDFSILSAAFGTEIGDSGYVPAADLDDNGEIGPADFAVLAANFGSEGDAP